MRLISSTSATIFWKRIFPGVWFGALLLGVVVTVSMGNWPAAILGLAAGMILTAVGWFSMKGLLWDLADEVWDDGDALVVRKGKQQERILLSEIGLIGCDVGKLFERGYGSPTRVWLRTHHHPRERPDITFLPIADFWPWRLHPAVRDVVLRIEGARAAASDPG